MPGTINIALTQQFNARGEVLSGGLLYTFSAGTTTPQTVFQDTGLTIPHPNPIVFDASGRVPMFYAADGFIKIRLTDKNGVVIIAADQLLVVGPSTTVAGDSGGGGAPGDQSQLMQTGDIKARYSIIPIDGFVRLNGLTIGNTGSSATERADPTCQPLFEYLWPFPGIALAGFAKGASALDDFNASPGRQLILPDMRGRTLAGLDNMGNPASANRLTTAGFGFPATTLGNFGGLETNTLTAAQLAAHAHALASQHFPGGALSIGAEDTNHDHLIPAMTTSFETAEHSHGYTLWKAANIGQLGSNTVGATAGDPSTTDASPVNNHQHTIPANTYATGLERQGHAHAVSGSTQNAGSTTPHANVQPTMVLTFYMKM